MGRITRIGSVVRVNVSFQQKCPPGSVLRCPTAVENGVMTKLCTGAEGLTSLRLRRITSSPSQTLRRRLVRTTNDGRRRECSARRLPPSVAALFFTLRRTVDNTVDLYAAKPDIRSESRFLPNPPAFDAPRYGEGGSRRNIAIPFGTEKLEWLGYPMAKKFENIFIRFGAIHERDGQTDGQTDTACRRIPRLCICIPL